ncbi:MAG: CCXG family PEP-CTERM protein [Myxococcota bacterium]
MPPFAISNVLNTLLCLSVLCVPVSAAALDFRVDFRNSTYQTQVGDTFSDLLAQHESETLIQSSITQGLENISTSIYAGGVTNNYSMLMTTTIDIDMSGEYEFRVGTDWGRGGAAALIDDSDGSILYERVITDDVWWSNDFNNSDVFATSFSFTAGESYSLYWVGFEGCCGGSTTAFFSVDGGAFETFTDPNFAPFTAVPEPGTALLTAMGLVGLAARRRNG